MFNEHVTVRLSMEQAERVRRDAVNRLFAMNAPVADWEVMKAEIEGSRYPELPGWKP
jgi:hypothetical protein